MPRRPRERRSLTDRHDLGSQGSRVRPEPPRACENHAPALRSKRPTQPGPRQLLFSQPEDKEGDCPRRQDSGRTPLRGAVPRASPAGEVAAEPGAQSAERQTHGFPRPRHASASASSWGWWVPFARCGGRQPGRSAPRWHVPDGEILYVFISLLLIAWPKEASWTGSNGNSSDSSTGRAEPGLSRGSPERKCNKAEAQPWPPPIPAASAPRESCPNAARPGRGPELRGSRDLARRHHPAPPTLCLLLRAHPAEGTDGPWP